MIEYRNVEKIYKVGSQEKTALNNLELNVKKGASYGFLGPNGAGKSTAIKALMGFVSIDSGSIRVLGTLQRNYDYRANIGYLSELPFFYQHLTAQETLVMSGALSGLPKNVIRERARQLLDQLDLHGAQYHRISHFSKGMKQRLGIANALIHDPEILIFDEPMSGLDPMGRHLVKQLILQLRREGKTIFFSSHILNDVEELCDCIGIINKGRLLYTGSVDNLLLEGGGLEERFVQLIQKDNGGNVDVY